MFGPRPERILPHLSPYRNEFSSALLSSKPSQQALEDGRDSITGKNKNLKKTK